MEYLLNTLETPSSRKQVYNQTCRFDDFYSLHQLYSARYYIPAMMLLLDLHASMNSRREVNNVRIIK